MAQTRSDGNWCFVCGADNPDGLHLHFRMEGDVCRGEFTPGPTHGGFDGLTHGGILFSVLDDVLANWLFQQGARGFTARYEIRYREPLPLGTPVRLEAHLVQRKRRLFMLKASARRADSDQVIAETEAGFMVEDFGSLGATSP